MLTSAAHTLNLDEWPLTKDGEGHFINELSLTELKNPTHVQ